MMFEEEEGKEAIAGRYRVEVERELAVLGVICQLVRERRGG